MPELPDILYTFIPNEDLRTNQYHAVRVVCFSARWDGPLIGLCGAGQKPIGILQNAPNLPGVDPGEFGTVMIEGISYFVVTAAIACGASWMSDANGHGVIATADNWVGGQVIEPGVLSPTPTGGETTTVAVGCHNPWFTDDTYVGP